MSTVRGPVPSITKPPMNVWVLLTYPRVETFANTVGEEFETRMVPPVPVTTNHCSVAEYAAVSSVDVLTVEGLSPEKRCVQFLPSWDDIMVPCSPAAT